MTTEEDWPRLGELLIARRVQIGWRNRSAFAEHIGLSHDRTLSDIEKARRTNFDASTIALIENAYGWDVGSVRTVLAGGMPTALPLDEVASRNPALFPRVVGRKTTTYADGSEVEEITLEHTVGPDSEDAAYAARGQALRDASLDELLAEVARRARGDNPEAR